MKIFLVVETGVRVASSDFKKKAFSTREEAQELADEMNRGERLATVEYVVEEFDLDLESL
jgi:hypothetical protein